MVEVKPFAASLIDVGNLAVLVENSSRKTETKRENQEMFPHFCSILGLHCVETVPKEMVESFLLLKKKLQSLNYIIGSIKIPFYDEILFSLSRNVLAFCHPPAVTKGCVSNTGEK